MEDLAERCLELNFLKEKVYEYPDERIRGFDLDNTPYFFEVEEGNKYREWKIATGASTWHLSSLDEVLNNVEEDIQEKIVFHLDLLMDNRRKIPGISHFVKPGVWVGDKVISKDISIL